MMDVWFLHQLFPDPLTTLMATVGYWLALGVAVWSFCAVQALRALLTELIGDHPQ